MEETIMTTAVINISPGSDVAVLSLREQVDGLLKYAERQRRIDQKIEFKRLYLVESEDYMPIVGDKTQN